MNGKSINVTVKISLGTFNESLQTESFLKDVINGITEGLDEFSNGLTKEGHGNWTVTTSILSKSETWE